MFYIGVNIFNVSIRIIFVIILIRMGLIFVVRLFKL